MMDLWGISLFCGAGGLDHGVESTERMEVRLGVDLNPDVEPTWRANAKLGSRPDSFMVADVRDLKASDLPPGADFILGSTPCQAFSHANSDRDPDDPDIGYSLVRTFLDLVRAYRPRAAPRFRWAMENVPALRPIMRQRDGWVPRTTVLNSADFGTPQIRHRLFAGDYPDPLPTHSKVGGQSTLGGARLAKWVSVREAFGLPAVRRSHRGGTEAAVADDRPGFAVGTQTGSGTSRTTMFTIEQADAVPKRRPRSLDRPARTVIAGGSGEKTVPLLVSGFSHGRNADAHSPAYSPDRPARVVGEDPDLILQSTLWANGDVPRYGVDRPSRVVSTHPEVLMSGSHPPSRRTTPGQGGHSPFYPADGPARGQTTNPDWIVDSDAPAPTMYFGGGATEETPQGGGAYPWSIATRRRVADDGMWAPWDERPSTTVMEGAISTPGHSDSMWMSLRRLTPMECAALQGFPKDFRWVDRRPRKDGSPRKTLLYSMIGNAVPPQFGRAIGEAILREADAVELRDSVHP